MTDLVQKIADAVWARIIVPDLYEKADIQVVIRQALADAGGAVAWQYRWMNPSNTPNQPDSMLAWKDVEPSVFGQTVQEKIDELRTYKYDGKPCYEVRALYAHPTHDSGRVAELEAQLAASNRHGAYLDELTDAHADRIAALEQQLTESLDREGRMREAAHAWVSEYENYRDAEVGQRKLARLTAALTELKEAAAGDCVYKSELQRLRAAGKEAGHIILAYINGERHTPAISHAIALAHGLIDGTADVEKLTEYYFDRVDADCKRKAVLAATKKGEL